MTPLDRLLESYRATAISERDKGTAFEKLVAAWLVADPVQSKRFAQVELWSDWARRRELDRTDTGIDLVGMLHDGGFAAIQCKFFDANRRIRKEDIDTFISASAKPAFAERLIVETTDMPWSANAETMLHGQMVPTAVIGLRALRESQVDWSATPIATRSRRWAIRATRSTCSFGSSPSASRPQRPCAPFLNW